MQADLHNQRTYILNRNDRKTIVMPSRPWKHDVVAAVDRLVQRCVEREVGSAEEVVAAIDRILAEPPRALRTFPHTPAFESQPPRIVVDFADDTDVDIAMPQRARFRFVHWLGWLGALVCGAGLGTAVVHLV